MLRAMISMSGRCGLIPEQVWDTAALPAQNLFPGRPAGSAMPLVWAHAEFIKLTKSLRLGRAGRSAGAGLAALWRRQTPAARAHWTRHMRIGTIRAGQALRLVFAEPAVVHWGIDDWQQPQDTSPARACSACRWPISQARRLRPASGLSFPSRI